jgi:nitrogen-specific signal transduction histidine kinase/CheY-like chemotaxis protein
VDESEVGVVDDQPILERDAEDDLARVCASARPRGPVNLDALSVLAGGVAHHFNNLLCVILGYAELLMDELHGREEWAAQAREIYGAADKAASLAHQLLAFSRKQRAAVEVVDLNALVEGLESLLRPMVTEAVELRFDLDSALPQVHANRMQLELSLINLALNAKDAMPQGGTITISTERMHVPERLEQPGLTLEPGTYARLAVIDTGHGVAPEIRDRLFEPFFTTKDVGQGAGLGLSMVHGIVRQAGGQISLTSEEGEGTTVTMYLPATARVAQPVLSVEPVVLAGGNEAILVVEDEERVRRLVLKTLSKQGYTVMAAGEAGEAFALLEQHGSAIQLLVTDVVLPGCNGLDLARRVRERLPDIPVLYISGYGSQDLSRLGPLDPSAPLLPKPFRPPELIRAVRAILDRNRALEQAA